MLKEKTPVLSGSIPAFETFMMEWELLSEKHKRLKPWIDVGLEWASEYYKRMDWTNAYIVAMCKPLLSSIDCILTFFCFIVIMLRLFLPLPFHMPIPDCPFQTPIHIPCFVSHVTFLPLSHFASPSLVDVVPLHPYLGLWLTMLTFLSSYLRYLVWYSDPLWQAFPRPFLYLALASAMTKP